MFAKKEWGQVGRADFRVIKVHNMHFNYSIILYASFCIVAHNDRLVVGASMNMWYYYYTVY